MAVKLDFETIVGRARLVHGDTYEYPIDDFDGVDKPMTIRCKEHGLFKQSMTNHLDGHGCPKCGHIKAGAGRKFSFEMFIAQSNKVHNGKYSYPNQDFISIQNKLTIVCPIHGTFAQTGASHLRGSGCKKCRDAANAQKNGQIAKEYGEKFPSRSREIHGDRYIYTSSVYVNANTAVEIICKEHGPFWMTPHCHIGGRGNCPNCNGNKTSTICCLWLDASGLPRDAEHREVRLVNVGNGLKRVDGFDPTTNTVYEFYGDYYHGNPNKYDPKKQSGLGDRTFGDLYRATLKREKLIKKAGYNLITIWESDFIALSRRTV